MMTATDDAVELYFFEQPASKSSKFVNLFSKFPLIGELTENVERDFSSTEEKARVFGPIANCVAKDQDAILMSRSETAVIKS